MTLNWWAIPSDHPGWDALIDGIKRVSDNHPEGHDCWICRQWRAEYELEEQVRRNRAA